MRSLSHEKKPEVRNRVSLYHLSFDTKIVIETRFLFPQRAIPARDPIKAESL